jgi:hypothetical protein
MSTSGASCPMTIFPVLIRFAIITRQLSTNPDEQKHAIWGIQISYEITQFYMKYESEYLTSTVVKVKKRKQALIIPRVAVILIIYKIATGVLLTY